MRGINFRSPEFVMRSLFRKFCQLHWLLVINLFALIAWGIWAIYNASSFREGANFASLWRSQLQWVGVSTIIFLNAAIIDYRWTRWGGLVIYLGGVGVMLMPRIFDIGAYGARGAIRSSLIDVPTSPVAMMATVVGVAVVFGHFHVTVPLLRKYWLLIVAASGLAAIPMLILLEQPDLGAALIIGVVLILMLLVASPAKHFTLLLGVGVCMVPLWYNFCLKPFQKKRVDVMVQMVTDQKMEVRHDAYMSDKLKIAVGSAGFNGKGPLSTKVEGRSVHRTYFTPTEAINDFIYAVIVEEFGLLGGLFQILLFLILFLLCIHVAYVARDGLGRMLVVGVVALLFVCSLQNMAMNLCMFPITGQPLPFTSFGGVYLTLCMFMMGLVQSVWIHRHDIAPMPPPLLAQDSAENMPPPSQAESIPHLDG